MIHLFIYVCGTNRNSGDFVFNSRLCSEYFKADAIVPEMIKEIVKR